MLTIHLISLFPESVRPYLDTSIMQRAQDKGLFAYILHNLADYSVRNTRRVDDRPYGWGAGTLITIEPIATCLRAIEKQYGKMPILLTSPRWVTLSQHLSWELAERGENYIIICGHYEWVDARIHDLFDIREISIGNYVLSSGELASLVIIDSMVRLIPGVLTPESLSEESFAIWLSGKKEYPQYSRPEAYEDIRVPSVLLSGDLRKIQEWNMEHTI
jgi:tRNA (guanine37-N1)-methyltransferase